MEQIKEYLKKRKPEINWAIKTFTDAKLQSFAKGELLMIESLENYIEKLEQKQ